MAALKQIDMAASKIPRTGSAASWLADIAHPPHRPRRLDIGFEDEARDSGRPIIAPKKQKA
ncbi:MAG: hypothetical protein WCB58_03310 [Acidobacteriaceae bacterium]